MHCGRESVIRGLAHVYVVIRVNEFFPKDLVCSVSDHLIGIHVGLGTASRLPYYKRKMVHESSVCHLSCCLYHGTGFFLRHLVRSKFPVCHAGRLLQQSEGLYYLFRHGLKPYSYAEIVAAPLCLGSPVSVGRHQHLTHGIVFFSVIHNPPLEIHYFHYIIGTLTLLRIYIKRRSVNRTASGIKDGKNFS